MGWSVGVRIGADWRWWPMTAPGTGRSRARPRPPENSPPDCASARDGARRREGVGADRRGPPLHGRSTFEEPAAPVERLDLPCPPVCNVVHSILWRTFRERRREKTILFSPSRNYDGAARRRPDSDRTAPARGPPAHVRHGHGPQAGDRAAAVQRGAVARRVVLLFTPWPWRALTSPPQRRYAWPLRPGARGFRTL